MKPRAAQPGRRARSADLLHVPRRRRRHRRARPPDDLPSELRVRVRQGELISEFSRLALAGTDFDALLDAAARLAADGLGAPLAKVLQHTPGADDSLLVRAGVGWRPGVVGRARLGADLASPAGYALKTGAPVISNHLDTEDRFRTPALMVEHGARRAVNVVVRGQREPFGVLEVDSRDPGAVLAAATWCSWRRWPACWGSRWTARRTRRSARPCCATRTC